MSRATDGFSAITSVLPITVHHKTPTGAPRPPHFAWLWSKPVRCTTHGIEPAPRRLESSWTEFPRRQAASILRVRLPHPRHRLPEALLHPVFIQLAPRLKV